MYQIETYLNDNWTDTVICYPNVAFTEPTPDIGNNWIRADILPGDGEIMSLGTGGRNRQNGVLFINIFTPQRTGMKDSFTISDSLKTLFNRVNIDQIQFTAPNFDLIGRADNNKWLQTGLTFPFYYTETT